MCGIAGWVDFTSDLTREADTLRAMVRTLERRGPDDEGMWLSPHAALGHRRLSVIDLAGSRQPMGATGNSRSAVISYSGEVYNYRSLRSELQSLGQMFSTAGDTEVVLRSCLVWGADAVARLDGIFAFALWDVPREELLLVRDRLGVKPLYYLLTPTGVVFGSEPKALLAHPAVAREVDADGLRDILSVAKNPGHAVFRDVHEVPPGYLLRVSRDGAALQRYWKLEVHEHPDDLPTTVGRVRGLLKDVIAAQLRADVPLCTLLSGGLDSSTLTAFATRAAVADGGDPVRSFAVRNEPSSNDDHVYACLLAKHAGSHHTEVTVDTVDLLNPALREGVLSAYDLPLAKGDEHASLLRLFEAVGQHSTVALSGECGDEVFGGYRWQRNPEAVHSGTFPWVHSGRHRHRGLELLLSPELLARLDLAAYERDSHATAVAEIDTGSVLDPVEARFRQVTYLALTRHAQVLFDRKDRLSMAHGLEVRVPFAAHALVEYTFNVPWAMKSFDGREKSLLRAAGRGLLPPAVSERPKTPYPSVVDTGYDEGLRKLLAEAVCEGDTPVLPYLNPVLAREVRRSGASALPEGLSRAALETVLQWNTWLAKYRVRVVL
ncbi:asparagine synthase (glutamine-hydrolyzing) [Actinoplanes sp. NPDC049681]|uniref:asparagine synthase (glutamine-hydrolyzing) n=1 Tax=Actinoplanes sp. NPDC049681 TaxID=3363905 RepID=UPI0037A71255